MNKKSRVAFPNTLEECHKEMDWLIIQIAKVTKQLEETKIQAIEGKEPDLHWMTRANACLKALNYDKLRLQNHTAQIRKNEGPVHAAAFKLLYALEDLLAVQYDGDPRRQESCELCAAARSAIAKARGEQQ